MPSTTHPGCRVLALLLGVAAIASSCAHEPTGPSADNILAVVDVDGRAPSGPGLAIIHIDGTGYKWLAANADLPTWLPDGTGILFVRQLSATDEFPHIYLTNLTGDTTRVIAPGGALVAEWYPVPAPDGQSIYFTGRTASEGYGVWRCGIDGTNPSRIGPTPMLYGTGVDRVFSVSPDGRYVLFESARSGEQRLATLDVNSGEVVELPFRGQIARWSPDGGRIAYVNWGLGAVHLVRIDGTDDRMVSNPKDTTYYGPGLTWSPDARYIVARAVGGLHLIDVVTRGTTPLTFAGPLGAPSWRPR